MLPSVGMDLVELRAPERAGQAAICFYNLEGAAQHLELSEELCAPISPSCTSGDGPAFPQLGGGIFDLQATLFFRS